MSNDSEQYLSMSDIRTRHARKERLMPNDVPKYVRCYKYPKTGGVRTNFIVVFTRMGRTGTNRHKYQGKGHPYLVAKQEKNGRYDEAEIIESTFPWYPMSFDQKVSFADLPTNVQILTKLIYSKLWKIGD